MTQLAIKWQSSFPPHPTSVSALPWKTCIKNQQKNFIKFHPSGYVATNSQSITKFDCCAAARLLNRQNIQK